VLHQRVILWISEEHFNDLTANRKELSKPKFEISREELLSQNKEGGPDLVTVDTTTDHL